MLRVLGCIVLKNHATAGQDLHRFRSELVPARLTEIHFALPMVSLARPTIDGRRGLRTPRRATGLEPGREVRARVELDGAGPGRRRL